MMKKGLLNDIFGNTFSPHMTPPHAPPNTICYMRHIAKQGSYTIVMMIYDHGSGVHALGQYRWGLTQQIGVVIALADPVNASVGAVAGTADPVVVSVGP